MSYVDAIHEKAKDTITVVERVDGKRIVTELPNTTFTIETKASNEVFMVKQLLK